MEVCGKVSCDAKAEVYVLTSITNRRVYKLPRCRKHLSPRDNYIEKEQDA